LLTKYKTIANTITNTLVIPRSLAFEPVETLSGDEYSSFSVTFLTAKFSIFLSNTGHQVIVTSKDKVETLAIVHQEWDSVVIGQSLSEAIQKWIDINLKENIIEVGAYGFKLKSIYQVGVFAFITIEYFNQDGTVYSERKQLYSVHTEVGKKALLLLDLIAINGQVDLTLIPTNNTQNPKNTALLNEYQGVRDELDYLIKTVMKLNYTQANDQN
jgi:hypothetical protein